MAAGKIIVAAVLLLALGSLTSCAERTQQVTPAELGALARFSQALQRHYETGMGISDEMADAIDVIDRYVDGLLAEDEMHANVGAVRAAARVAIDDYKRGLEGIGTRPTLPDRKRERGMQAFESMVRGLAGHLEAQWASLESMMEAAVGGNETAYNAVLADSMVLAREMIASENVALETQMLGVTPNHPQAGLFEAAIGGNLAAQGMLIVLEDGLRNREVRIEMARDAIKQGLARATSGIKAGRRDAAFMRLKAERARPVSEADRIGIRFMREISDTYGPAFDIEAEFVAGMRSYLDALMDAFENPAGGDSDALILAAEAFQADAVRLIDARMQEQMRRLQMAEDYSSALAAAQ